MRGNSSLFLVFLVFFFAPSIAAGQEAKLTADQIVEKHLEAIGGRAALAKFKTRVAIGTIRKEDEPEGKMAIMSEYPNRLSVFYGFREYDLHMIYDGTKAFIRPALPRNVSSLIDKYQEILGSGLMFNSIALYNRLASSAPDDLKYENKGIKKVAGRPAYVVQLKAGKGTLMKLYFDTESFMWVRTDYGSAEVSKLMGTLTNDVVSQGGGEATVDFYIETSDFRDVDGVKLPFKFEQLMTSPILRQKAVGTIVGTIREYRNNIEIDPKMFQ